MSGFIGLDRTRVIEVREVADFPDVATAAAWLHAPAEDDPPEAV